MGRYLTNGYWTDSLSEALAKARGRFDVWLVHDGHNPKNGAARVIRWATVTG